MFISRQLSVLVATDQFAIWLYKTNDLAATVASEGYFDPALNIEINGRILRKGDLVLANLGKNTSNPTAAVMQLSKSPAQMIFITPYALPAVLEAAKEIVSEGLEANFWQEETAVIQSTKIKKLEDALNSAVS
ncbi:MAG: hypothetical protein OQJ97_06920 [Rhodospirillales bacterium]|nr:hypothetical protein [Rhodospirillales bacterium]